MPYREITFEKEQPFHIISHAVEGRKIFENEADCYRFIFQLHAANVGKPALNLWRKDTTAAAQALLSGGRVPSQLIIAEHPPLVYILDFALNVNHYHLYLVPNIEDSVPLYMRKLNGGFGKYFNLKHNRKGFLFSSRYKSILVQTDLQSDAVSRYVNTINPLDVYQPGWRENGLRNPKEALSFLEQYPFSSFPDKTGKRKSSILAPVEILEKYSSKDILRDKQQYINFIKDFLEQKLGISQDLFLE